MLNNGRWPSNSWTQSGLFTEFASCVLLSQTQISYIRCNSILRIKSWHSTDHTRRDIQWCWTSKSICVGCIQPVSIAAGSIEQRTIRVQSTDRFSIPQADTPPEERNLISFSPPPLILSFTAPPPSYSFSPIHIIFHYHLCHPSSGLSLSHIFKKLKVVYSRLWHFLFFETIRPFPLWYFPLTKDHFETTPPLPFISSTHHSSFLTAVWITWTPCPCLLRHCSVKPSFKSQQKDQKVTERESIESDGRSPRGALNLFFFFFWCFSFVYTSNSSSSWTSSHAAIRERAVTGFSAGLYHLK